MSPSASGPSGVGSHASPAPSASRSDWSGFHTAGQLSVAFGRQIIMVTHNPNLAVVCDAEQIIRASFDRRDQATIAYQSGSIEDGVINSHVVNVLEGTKDAFDNRSGKYH